VKQVYEENGAVMVKIGERPPMTIRVLKRLDGDFYLLDWGACGFNSLLNTVRIPVDSILSVATE